MNERKEEYLKTITTTGLNETACFKKVASYEEDLGKDLSDWNAKEIIGYYKSVCTPSVDFLYNIHNVFRKYTAWCLHENLLVDNINHYDEISMEVLYQCINKSIADQRIISREDLLNIIKKFDNPRDQFLCLACFEGLAGQGLEEIINLNISDFKNGKLTTCTGKVISYSDELYKYAKDAEATTTYYISNSRKFDMVGDSGRVMKRIVSKNKDDAEQEVKPQVLYVKLKDIQRETNIPAFTSKALKESGRIHMIKETMKKHQCSAADTFKLNSDITNVYGKLISIPAYLIKYNDFLK